MTNLEAELLRVAERDDVVKAWTCRHPDAEILAAARSLPPGPLHGWTLGVKDVIDTADLPTERGSVIHSGRWPGVDAACVAVARQAGAQVVGKTATTEFALFTPTDTTNPHDPTRTPGGSSSGSAAAVADGHVRLAFGTQTVGSVLRPAAYCGVVGFKPTHQLVPLAGVAPLSPSFDTVGWFTNDVADAATVFGVLSGGSEAPPVGEAAGAPRVGVYRSHQWSAAQPELDGVLAEAGRRLAAAGVEVFELEPLRHLEGFFEAADVVLHYEVARVFAWERAHHHELISPLVQRMLTRADGISHSDHVSARIELERGRRAHDDYLEASGLDALLTPAAPGEAPPLQTTGDSVFNRTWTSLGVPAIALPVGTGPLGLPVGLQLAGRSWRDGRLLEVAARVEAVVEASR